jgi:hypothetical protein
LFAQVNTSTDSGFNIFYYVQTQTQIVDSSHTGTVASEEVKHWREERGVCRDALFLRGDVNSADAAKAGETE